MSEDLEAALSPGGLVEPREIIRAFAESENQAVEPEELWCFDWQEQMARVAPVQLTNGLDVRALLRVVIDVPHSIYYEWGPPGAGGTTIYYPNVRTAFVPTACKPVNDHTRFMAVLSETVKLAKFLDMGLLFIGGWGWTYELELPPEQRETMRKAAMAFTSRHV